jgi:hypothetical protein
VRGRLKALTRGAAVALLVVGVGAATVPLGYADNDDNRQKSSSERELERSQREDHEFAGQVLEINTLKDPPELLVAGIDGPPMRIVVYKTDEIAKNGIRLGDHVSGKGEKAHEYLFHADQLFVDGHLGDNDNEEEEDEDD